MCSKDGSSGGKYGLAKKIKKATTKAPQRGPGVAELEKILREQQMNNDNMTICDRLSGHVNPSSSLYLPPLPRPPPSNSSHSPKIQPMDVYFVKKPDLVCAPLPPWFLGNVNSPSHNCANGFWPSSGRNGNHPSFLRTCESNSDRNGPRSEYIVPSMIRPPSVPCATRPSLADQQSALHYPQPMMNLCPVPSTRAPVQHQPVEHPSNQRTSANLTPNQPDEEKILVGVKRPWPFSMSIPSGPVPQCKYPSPDPTTSQAEQSNPPYGHSSLHFEHRNSILRNLNPASSKENTEMYRADDTALDGKMLKLGPPVYPSLWMGSKTKEPIVIVSDSSLHNDSLEEQCRESDSYGSVDQKPLYDFVPPGKHICGGETILILRHDSDQVRVQKVDLDLRL